ncbi:hypothetical protein FM103_08740 [Corynebacterium xerosis]|nr:hypothetical protein FM103_08740 [Corynebacterium xerosis]
MVGKVVVRRCWTASRRSQVRNGTMGTEASCRTNARAPVPGDGDRRRTGVGKRWFLPRIRPGAADDALRCQTVTCRANTCRAITRPAHAIARWASTYGSPARNGVVTGGWFSCMALLVSYRSFLAVRRSAELDR